MERLDHSAAIFDDQGRLLAQAEHIPVHLGSLPWGLVKTLEYCDREGIDLEESSMMVVNNPYIAGTHLNDVTVIRPIYQSNRLVAYAANKAHHADVGGKVPGSISIDAKSLFEEGVVIRCRNRSGICHPEKQVRRRRGNKSHVEIPHTNREEG